MKRSLVFFVVCISFMITPVLTHAQAPMGYSVTCNDGTSFSNGVEVTINQLRSGYTYQATAIGLNGFDPVLAVINPTTGRGLCNDDDASAATYSADLPSSGEVATSDQSAQVTFNQPNSGLANISLVVGGYNDQSGEFLLILEGMDATSTDGAGDGYSVNITPGMVASGVPLSVYMIAEETSLDPFIFLADSSKKQINDAQGNPIGCDDAGTANACWGQSDDLSNSYIDGNGNTVSGGSYDAMLSIPLSSFQVSSNRSENYLNFLMTTSPTQKTEGHYLVVFDIGQSDGSSSDQNSSLTGGDQQNGQTDNGQSSSGQNNGQNSSGQSNNGKGGFQNPFATPAPQNNSGSNGNNGGSGNDGSNSSGQWQGWSVTCNDGSSFDNGVEVVVHNLTSGSYTATAVGMNGFDPVLAVLDTTSQSGGLCNNDSTDARAYSADLPSSGKVASSSHSAQVTFDQTAADSSGDVSLIVGGNGNQTGEFLLILEGRGITATSGTGDAYSLNVTPGMVTSGIPLSMYMIAENTDLDPTIFQTDTNLNPLKDSRNNPIACDDAGDAKSCWGQSESLTNSSVTVSRGTLPGGSADSMLSFSLDGLQLNSDPTQNYFTFVMESSPTQKTTGKYILVFDVGIGKS